MVRGKQLSLAWFAVGISCWLLLHDRAVGEPGEKLWGKNLLHNPSFEEGADTQTGWTRRRAFSLSRSIVESVIEIDPTVARTGKQSLRFFADAKTTAWYSIESKPVPVKAGENYKVLGWIKTKEVHAVGRQPLHCNLHVRFSNVGGASVPIEGSRVVLTKTIEGTEDWTLVQRVVTAPEDAVEVRAGCVLTCSGKAWFDDISIQAQRSIPWREARTERITFFFEGDDAPAQGKIASTQEHLAAIESALGIKHEDTIRYYNYRSVERKEEITGNAADAHYVGSALHVVGWDDRHKLAHVVLRLMGESTLLLREGLAMYLSQKNLGVDLHAYLRNKSREEFIPPLSELTDDRQFKTIGVDLTFPAAGSFVRFLVEEYGMDKVKRLYSELDPGAPPAKFRKSFLKVFGKSVDDVQAVWLNFGSSG